MDIQLQQYIDKPKLTEKLINNVYQEEEQSSYKSTEEKQRKKLQVIKKCVTIIGIIIFFFYKIMFQAPIHTSIHDLLHQITATINYELNNNHNFYNISAIITQQIIEIQFIIILYFCIFKLKNTRMHFFICFFYGLRAMYLNVEKLPFPEGFVSYEPSFPSFIVPYGITRDFYYSGHTGIMLYTVIEAKRLKFHIVSKVNMLLMVIIILYLVSTRVHYTIDIFGGIFFTLWIDKHLSAPNYLYSDKIWSFFYTTLHFIYSKLCKKS